MKFSQCKCYGYQDCEGTQYMSCDLKVGEPHQRKKNDVAVFNTRSYLSAA